MANIPLKSIKFPDLADTYTVPSNAGELPYNKSATYPADTVGKALQNIGDSSAPAIIETAQGSIASFDDGADNVPVKDLVAEIVPLQSGSGDPSPDNVRPITGWTECNVVVSPTEDARDGETHTISFASAGTVYGGRLDVTSGVLTVDWKAVDMGSLTYESRESIGGTGVFVGYVPNDYKYAFDVKGLCSIYKYKGIVGATSGASAVLGEDGCGLYYASSSQPYAYPLLYICDTALAGYTPEQVKTAMSGQTFVYELATPQTYQLTPTEVKTLLKNNNIWADTGDVTVEYVADTKTFIENLVNA